MREAPIVMRPVTTIWTTLDGRTTKQGSRAGNKGRKRTTKRSTGNAGIDEYDVSIYNNILLTLMLDRDLVLLYSKAFL